MAGHTPCTDAFLVEGLHGGIGKDRRVTSPAAPRKRIGDRTRELWHVRPQRPLRHDQFVEPPDRSVICKRLLIAQICGLGRRMNWLNPLNVERCWRRQRERIERKWILHGHRGRTAVIEYEGSRRSGFRRRDCVNMLETRPNPLWSRERLLYDVQ